MYTVTVHIELLVIVEIVSIPEGLCIIVAQAERVEILGKSVYVVVWHHGSSQLQELVLEDDDTSVSVEQHLSRAHSRHTELEAWAVAPCKSQVACILRATLCVANRRKRLVQYVEGVVTLRYVLWEDSHQQALLALILNHKTKVFDLVAIRIASFASQCQVGCKAA